MNQREPKYRAWDVENKRMIYRVGFAFNDTGMEVILPKGNVGGGERIKEFGVVDGAQQRMVYLMQYTGMKDKNGKEIYEGDVVMWGHIEGGEEYPVRIAEVRIDPDIQFVAHNIPPVFNGKDCHTFHYGTFAYRDTFNWLDVIGNVFEAPELVEP